MTTRKTNDDLIIGLYDKFIEEFNPKIAEKILDILQNMVGGKRITLNTRIILYRERNETIMGLFDGGNYEELAIRYDRTEKQIRRIIHLMEDKNKEEDVFKDGKTMRKERDEQIRERFNGDNIAELAVHYKLSRNYIRYKIICTDGVKWKKGWKWREEVGVARKEGNEQVANRFNGHNCTATAIHFDLSESRSREILNDNRPKIIKKSRKPKVDIKSRNKEIRKQFRKITPRRGNYGELALRYGLTVKRIRNIVHKGGGSD